jgi:hypothetical protein
MKSNESSESYTIVIQEGEIYTGLSEEDFMDKMIELSQCYYECGYPSPDIISHIVTNGKTVHQSNGDNNSNNPEED